MMGVWMGQKMLLMNLSKNSRWKMSGYFVFVLEETNSRWKMSGYTKNGATKVNDLEKLETQIRAVVRKELDKENAGDSSLGISDVPVAAFGSRAHLKEKALSMRTWYRNFLMKGLHLVVLLAAGPGIRDTQCGFKMFTRSAAQKLFKNIQLKRWCFDVQLVYLCKCLKIPMLEISVTWSEIPGSKVNILSIPNILWELVLVSVGYRMGLWKIVA